MKRIAIFLFATIVACASIQAQEQERDLGIITPGVKLGLSIPNMRYSAAGYKEYKNEWIASGLGGIYVDYRFWKGLSVRPEFLYIGRGGNMSLPGYYLDYKIRVTYFDFRVPFIWTFMRDKKIQPYVGFGPTLDFVAGGKINYTLGDKSYQIPSYGTLLPKGAIAPVDFGLYFGAGCNFLIPITEKYKLAIGAEFGYHLGLVNNFSRYERTGTAHALNGYSEPVSGFRKNHDIEIAVSVGFPIDLNQLKRKDQPEPEPVLEEKKEPAISVEEKECYSLEEMIAFVTLGADISTKKICAFDDLKFDFGKATIRSGSEDYLQRLTQMLQTFPKMRIAINGHTDNVGKEDYNLRLSKQRARSVADYLIKHGIESSRLTTDGFGSSQPIGTNDTEEGRARNRRVEIDILNVQ